MIFNKVAVCSITLIALVGCGTGDTESLSTPISLADSPPVVIDRTSDPRFSQIVTLASGSADVLISLGLAKNVVGVSVTETRPELSDVPTVSPAHSVNIEQILLAKPDLILLDEGGATPDEIDQLKSDGAEVLILAPSFSSNEMFTKIRTIGEKLGLSSKADELVTQLKKPQAGAESGSLGDPARSQSFGVLSPPRVAFLYLRGNNSIYLIGGPGSGADELLKMAAAIDVGAESLSDPFTPLSAESMAQLNPDALLVMTKGLESVGGVTGLFNLPGIAQTTAAKNQSVIVVEDQLLLSFSTRTPALVEQLKSRLALLKPDSV